MDGLMDWVGCLTTILNGCFGSLLLDGDEWLESLPSCELVRLGSLGLLFGAALQRAGHRNALCSGWLEGKSAGSWMYVYPCMNCTVSV